MTNTTDEWVRIDPNQEKLTYLQEKKLDIIQKKLEDDVEEPLILAEHIVPTRLRKFLQYHQGIQKIYTSSLAGKSKVGLNMMIELIGITQREIEAAEKRLKYMK